MENEDLDILMREMEGKLKEKITELDTYLKSESKRKNMDTWAIMRFDNKANHYNGEVDGITKMINLLESKRDKSLSLDPNRS